MKKLLLIFPALALAVALPASAGWCGWGNWCDDVVKVENVNNAEITNMVESQASTGWNDANWNKGVGKIETGTALAEAAVQNQANDNMVEIQCSNCLSSLDKVKVENVNWAGVQNYVGAEAKTGGNDANGNGMIMMKKPFPCHPPIPVAEGKGIIKTGAAQAVTSVLTLVNSNVTKIK